MLLRTEMKINSSSNQGQCGLWVTGYPIERVSVSSICEDIGQWSGRYKHGGLYLMIKSFLVFSCDQKTVLFRR